MYGARHDLTEDFPEFSTTIHALKSTDTTFSRLLYEYDGMDKKIYGIEQMMLPVSDAYLGELKKRRLALKDQLFDMIRHRADQSPLGRRREPAMPGTRADASSPQ